MYEPIVQVLPEIETVGNEKVLREPLLLGRLFVPDTATMQDYFTYNGSLTTPPCLEVAIWIDFKDHQRLSHEQVCQSNFAYNFERYNIIYKVQRGILTYLSYVYIDLPIQEIMLAQFQLAAFRDLRTQEGNKLTHNFRPVQPLEDRIVLHNIPREQNTPKNIPRTYHRFDEHSGQRDVKVPFSIIALGVLFAILLFAI